MFFFFFFVHLNDTDEPELSAVFLGIYAFSVSHPCAALCLQANAKHIPLKPAVCTLTDRHIYRAG